MGGGEECERGGVGEGRGVRGVREWRGARREECERGGV